VDSLRALVFSDEFNNPVSENRHIAKLLTKAF
jgi:hypothetical protein